ncbi:Hypothetical predicted protein [Mytilus galloprovincialis]|uniref:DUF7918 domain-containing protein n=1 Tax=Mytilus galloprovincialis TaxID=29158 RepID=A0A8B6H156_MYTGA|nr:Hypothetical predicted protein [Mytilus galloprovincialis]
METTFSFSVLVGGKPLPEYKADGDTYIEANLHSQSSYIIQDTDDEGYQQHYPVTPFEIIGNFKNRLTLPCYLRLCVDGQQIWMKPFPPSYREQSFKVNGIKDNRKGTVKELLFSLPKITSQKDRGSKNWKSDLGTITLECLEAIEDGCFQTYQRQFIQTAPKNLSDRAVHQQATKQDCSKRGGIGVSTREGRGICTFENTDRMITMIRYKLGQRNFGKITLKYRTRHVLEDLGIIDKAWVSDTLIKDSVEMSPSEKGKVPSIIKQEGISLTLEKENVRSSKDKSASEPDDVHMNSPVSQKANAQPSKHSTALTDKSNKAVSDNILKPASESSEDNMAQKPSSIEENNWEMEIDSIKSRLRSRNKVTKTTEDDGKALKKNNITNKTIKQEAISAVEENNHQMEIDNIKKVLRSKKSVTSTGEDDCTEKSKTIKQEAINAQEKYNERVENVISKLQDLDCAETVNPRKLYCFSPSLVSVKREMIEENGKLGCHTPSDMGKNLFNGKLGHHSQSDLGRDLFRTKMECHSESDRMQILESHQIKKEMIDNEEKRFRYIEIDDDVIMLQEVDDDVVWMGDESCCFIDIEPDDVPVIDLVA